MAEIPKFGDRPLERRLRDHMSRQMTYAIHASNNTFPPHLLSGSRVKNFVSPDRNIHPDAFHAGPPATAQEITVNDEGYRHLYRIHRSSMDPAIWGDENTRGSAATMRELQGVPPQLFETVPLHYGDIDRNVHPQRRGVSPLVQVYRNTHENPGSLSYIIPKSLVESGEVEYLGTVAAPNEKEAAIKWEKDNESS